MGILDKIANRNKSKEEIEEKEERKEGMSNAKEVFGQYPDVVEVWKSGYKLWFGGELFFTQKTYGWNSWGIYRFVMCDKCGEEVLSNRLRRDLSDATTPSVSYSHLGQHHLQSLHELRDHAQQRHEESLYCTHCSTHYPERSSEDEESFCDNCGAELPVFITKLSDSQFQSRYKQIMRMME